jgi:hypothetical protein
MAVDVSGSMLAKDLKQTEWKQGAWLILGRKT